MGELMKLANGSDVRGIASEGVEGEKVNLTPQIAGRIAQAFVVWLAEKKKEEKSDLRIGVGHDSRITAQSLGDGVMAGIEAQKAQGVYCGLVSTPSMFMSTVYPEFAFDGAVMITASHLPFNRNGLKFFTREGGLEHEDIQAILSLAENMGGEELPANAGGKKRQQADLISAYAKDLRNKIRDGVGASREEETLAGLRIVVDAGNGAGGFFVEKVLKPLGADTAGSQFLEPDGRFPNHIPNPENKEAMESLQKAVLANKADLGIIFDTDVDRMSAVLPDGSEINRDALIAMAAAIIAGDYPGGTVVTDSVTSHRLTQFLEKDLGMKHRRYMRGYRNVINESIRLNREGTVSPLAIETSGHGAFSENYFLDDGAYLAVKFLIAAARAKREGKLLASYIQNMPEAYEEREYRLKIRAENFKEYGNRVLETVKERTQKFGYPEVPGSCEGVRVFFGSEKEADPSLIQGWMLIRLSLHDPVMPVNMEGVRAGDCDKMKDYLKRLLEGYSELDIRDIE